MAQTGGLEDNAVLKPLVGALQAGTSELTVAAREAMEADLPWFNELPAHDRSWLGVVAQESIARFISWLENPTESSTSAAEIFRVAPPELARSISLQNTVAIIRLLVNVVEERAQRLVPETQRPYLREAAMIYSREVAFSAAEVYARAAESRGAWDARQEALTVDAIVRGAPDESLRSRATTLGWMGDGSVVVVVGSAPPRNGDPSRAERVVATLRAHVRHLTSDSLVGIQGDRVIVVLGASNPTELARELAAHFPEGPIVIGNQVEDLTDAGRSARSALAGVLAVGAWGKAPRPVAADELLPERMLNGDPLARHALVNEIYLPLLNAGTPLVDTLEEYLSQGRSLEGAARELFVHPNTVRYRLRRISDVVGWDPTDAREGYVLHTALAVGRLSQSRGA